MLTMKVTPRFLWTVPCVLLGITMPLAAQNPAGDVWKRVPPLATTCFPDDAARDRLSKLQEQLGADLEKQKEVNNAAREKFDNMDMGEKAQRMQAFMMKNPQAAMAMMQQQQAAGAAGQTDVPEIGAATQRLEQEFKAMQAKLRADIDQAVKPIQARQKELIKAKTVLVGEVQEPAFAAAADHAQYVQLVADENTAIEKACAPYFGADGSVHKWLARYRTDVSEKLIATSMTGDAALLLQMQAMDVSGSAYKPTAPLQYAQQYVGKMLDLDGIRPAKAKATVGMRK